MRQYSFELHEKEAAGAITEAGAPGLKDVSCAWIPHPGDCTDSASPAEPIPRSPGPGRGGQFRG